MPLNLLFTFGGTKTLFRLVLNTVLMKSQYDSDFGVSKVVGVILIIALTVAIGSVVGLTAMSFSPSDPTPTASYEVTIDSSSDTLTLHQTVGESLEVQHIELVINGDVVDMKSEYEGQEISEVNSIEYHLPADVDTSDEALVRHVTEESQGIIDSGIEISID